MTEKQESKFLACVPIVLKWKSQMAGQVATKVCCNESYVGISICELGWDYGMGPCNVLVVIFLKWGAVRHVLFENVWESSGQACLSLMRWYQEPFLSYNLSSVFGDGHFSKSFLISRQDWFSSTIKSTKTFKALPPAWRAVWVWTPCPASIPRLASGLRHTSNSKVASPRPEGVRPCALLVSQAGVGYINSSFNSVIAPTTKRFVIPQNQEPRQLRLSF